ncbi:hypothetical protein [Hymenobacter canadensis]|uniref:DUF4105 domain-containing protein n=1 Tax=Hymenobacter canadensis TaxID=2999067 RepID=A0ABY7LTT4_9BACT|nr:hypothetical protein [Hymenobacter canadensis]WBA42293.1 hypothetical protein O3303_01755 [Hymenobacter canadensis]
MLPLNLHLPRRHRRPLLFPPGLLALVWLLWLGCVALPQMRGINKPQGYVTQLTMLGPKLPGAFDSFSPPRPLWPPYFSSLELAAFRPWQNIRFTGNLWQDYFSYQQTRVAANYLGQDTTYRMGMKLVFEQSAAYKSLIFALDQLQRRDIKRYWLDIYRLPTTLYAFTDLPIAANTTKSKIPMMGCGYGDDVVTLRQPPMPVDFMEFITPDWRNSLLLLLLMALLSAVRLGRQFLIR